jgi:hypothetical protein
LPKYKEKKMANKKRFLRMLVAALTVVMAASCTTFQVSGLEVRQMAADGSHMGDFNIKVGVHKFLGNSGGVNLFNISSDATDPAIIQAIRTEIQNRGGTAARNVKIEYKATVLNLLLNWVTFSLYAPVTAYVTGSIIK